MSNTLTYLATKESVDNHVDNKNNPHGVTAEQIGAATTEYVNEKFKGATGKFKMHNYIKQAETEGQTTFSIDLETFDVENDQVLVQSGITMLFPYNDFNVVDGNVVLAKGVPLGRTIGIYVLKLINTTEPGLGNLDGSVIALDSLPVDRINDGISKTEVYSLLSDAGMPAQVIVTIDSGSTVTAIKGDKVITVTSDGTAVLNITEYGEWEIKAELGDKYTTEIVLIDNVKQYELQMEYFEASIVVTSEVGCEITVVGGGSSQTKTSTGNDTFVAMFSGEYTVSATYNGATSNTTTLNVVENGGSYNANLNFIKLTVNVASGSNVIVAKDGYSYTKSSNGSVLFYLPETGVWSVTCSLNGTTINNTVDCSGYNSYSIQMDYYKIFGVSINLADSNPDTCITYTDDAVGMTGGSSDWDNMAIFKDIKPCLLSNGVVSKYLNKNNFAQDENGSSVDITSGSAGDVMIEIPKVGVKIATSGNILTVKITDSPNMASDGFHYYAHTRSSDGDCSKLYIGAYIGSVSSDKLRSLSEKTPKVSQTIGTFRTQAKANGSEYDLISFYPLTLLQCLFLIRYKSLNSQTALGRGYVDDNSASISTGGTNTKGMYYGETTGKQQVKFAGIEDFYGNCYYWIDGLFSDSNRNILTAFKDFNDTGSGYTNRGQGATSNIYGYMSKPQGTTEAGFIIKEKNGSTTTYFSDYAFLNASRLAIFGGDWNDGDSAGAFLLQVTYSASSSHSDVGARLMFLKADD